MDKIDEVLARGVAKIFPTADELEKVLRSGKKIKLYQGFDPSMPSLHLGNLVGLIKLRQFQDLGHRVIFLVGDFTGMIGDPTDKSATRPKLTREQVRNNCRNWQKQAGQILNFSGENPAKLLFNGSWLDQVTFKDLIEISSNFTIQQMLGREFIQSRIKAKKPIYLHEFLYPVAQAYDSVHMEVNLEVGGDDQVFNMLCGRTLMKALKNQEKYVLATKLLVDKDGHKVGKTTGNALFLDAGPAQMYGGVMSFPDEVIPLAFELLTLVPYAQIKKFETDLKNTSVNPMQLKKQLALEIVKMVYGEKEAQSAQKDFEANFQNKGTSVDLPEIRLTNSQILLPKFLLDHNLVGSLSIAKQLIRQGSVDIDGQPVTTEVNLPLLLKNGSVIRVGKKKLIKIKL